MAALPNIHGSNPANLEILTVDHDVAGEHL